MINEHTAVQQHGIATITCLLSGLRIFNEAPAEQRALIRLVKGVHGLHVYATEFWTEYLLLDAEALHGSERSSPLLETACQLAGLLENSGAALPREGTGDADEADERIQLIRQHEVLYRHVRAAIKARSRKTLELELLRSQGTYDVCAIIVRELNILYRKRVRMCVENVRVRWRFSYASILSRRC